MEKFSTLKAFVHVPKTAGSMVNGHLNRSELLGKDHIEAWRGKPELAKTQLRKLDWVSGHVNFPEMRAMLSAASPRPLEFYTALRDPVQQLASHYNWLIEIYHRGKAFYENHPAPIKNISERVRNADNSNPFEVIAQLEAAPGLFLNQQCRTVLGENLGDMSAEMLHNRLSVFRYIACETTLPTLIQNLLKRPSGVLSHDNASTYHFDPSIFQSKELQTFLAQRHAADLALYGFVVSRSDDLFGENSYCPLPQEKAPNSRALLALVGKLRGATARKMRSSLRRQ